MLDALTSCVVPQPPEYWAKFTFAVILMAKTSESSEPPVEAGGGAGVSDVVTMILRVYWIIGARGGTAIRILAKP